MRKILTIITIILAVAATVIGAVIVIKRTSDRLLLGFRNIKIRWPVKKPEGISEEYEL